MSDFNRFVIKAVIGIVMLNIGGLWAVSFVQYRQLQQLLAITDTQTAIPTTSDTSTTVNENPVVPDESLVAQLAAVDQRLDQLESVPTAKPTVITQTLTQTGSTQEAVVFLGTGTTNNREWTLIPGASVEIKTSDYPQLKSMRFEAALGITGGEVYARLINQTTGAVIGSSEVSHNQQVSAWKQSAAFAPISGTAIYTVQLRSSSGEQAELTGARVRLLSQ